MARVAPMQEQGAGKPERLGKPVHGLLQNALDKVVRKGTVSPREFSLQSYGDQELDFTDDNSTENLSKQLVNSSVVNFEGKSPGVGRMMPDECRIDYTDEVKRKYFTQEKIEKDPNDRFSRPRNEGHFNNDEEIPFKIYATDSSYIPTSTQSSLSSGGVGLNSRRSNNTEAIKIQSGVNRNQTKCCRPNTPPLTLYSDEAIPLVASSSQSYLSTRNISDNDDNRNQNNPNTDEKGPGRNMSSLEQSFAMSEDVTITHNQNSVGDFTPQDGSVGSLASSKGSMSTATHSLIKQPVLYSAIGSLENINCNSLTNLNKRFLTPSKEFCKPGGKAVTTVPSILIPPARPYQAGQQEHRISRASSSSRAAMSKPNPQIYHQRDRSDAASRASDVNATKNKTIYGSAKKGNDPRTNNSKDMNPSFPPSMPDSKSSVSEHFRFRRTQTGHPQTIDNISSIAIDIKPEKINSDNQKNDNRKPKSNKKVTYGTVAKTKSAKSKTIEMFRPSSDAYTPRIERKTIKYKTAEARPSVQQMSSPMGTLQRPNFRDALRRVAMIIHQHIVKIESRFEQQVGASPTQIDGVTNDGLFHASMRDMFNEDLYRTPTYKCNMARIPMARPGMVYGLRKIKVMYTIPSETEIYDFGHQLFKSVQLSSECSIVCLIYVERLMEVAKVPLLACTWRPIFMCGLLLASKVWQDLSSWNIEFSSVYPQFSLEAINKLELNFLRNVKWDLYISSSSYAKYYFALRSLVEKKDFRQRYNRMVGGVGNVAQAEALKVQERTERVKEEALLKLSRSM